MENFQSLTKNLQQYVCNALLSSEWLSAVGCKMLVENSRDVSFEIEQAIGKQGIVGVVMTPNMEYIGHNGSETGWQTDIQLMVSEYVPVNRAKTKLSVATCEDVVDYCAEYLAGPQGAVEFGTFCPKSIDVSENEGLLNAKLTLKTCVMSDIGGEFIPVSGHVILSPYATKDYLEQRLSDYAPLSAVPVLSDYAPISALDNYYTKPEAQEISANIVEKIPTTVKVLSVEYFDGTWATLSCIVK